MADQKPRPQQGIDEFPADRSQLARMTPEERSAIYLNQIRKGVTFFVLLAIAGIVLGFVALIRH